jgi:hypothetical protein
MNDLTIPDIRARMRELAVELDCSELSFLADATVRRYHGRRAPARLPPLTPQQEEAIRSYALLYPKASQMDMANRFHTNPGRISEALYGKRG